LLYMIIVPSVRVLGQCTYVGQSLPLCVFFFRFVQLIIRKSTFYLP